MQKLPNDDRPAELGVTAKLVQRVWSPGPVSKPRIEPRLGQLDWPERCAEVLRHALLSIEYWLSQGGWLREWIRLSIWLCVVLFVAALLVVPPVTAILEGVRDWTALVSVTVGNINAAVTALPSIVLALATGILLLKLIQLYRSRRRQQPRHPYEHYD